MFCVILFNRATCKISTLFPPERLLLFLLHLYNNAAVASFGGLVIWFLKAKLCV